MMHCLIAVFTDEKHTDLLQETINFDREAYYYRHENVPDDLPLTYDWAIDITKDVAIDMKKKDLEMIGSRYHSIVVDMYYKAKEFPMTSETFVKRKFYDEVYGAIIDGELLIRDDFPDPEDIPKNKYVGFMDWHF